MQYTNIQDMTLIKDNETCISSYRFKWFKPTVCAKHTRRWKATCAVQMLNQTAYTSNRTQAALKMTYEHLVFTNNEKHQYIEISNNMHECH